jgi:hypothetical protein
MIKYVRYLPKSGIYLALKPKSGGKCRKKIGGVVWGHYPLVPPIPYGNQGRSLNDELSRKIFLGILCSLLALSSLA